MNDWWVGEEKAGHSRVGSLLLTLHTKKQQRWTIFQSLGSALGRRTARRGSKCRTTWFSYLLQRFGSKCSMSRFTFSPCWMQRNEIFMRYVHQRSHQVAAWLRLNSKINNFPENSMHWSDCNAPLCWFLLGPNKNQMNELLEARKLNKNILAVF